METFKIESMLKPPLSNVDYVLDGIHFGRGDSYDDETNKLKHQTIQVQGWRIVNEKLDPLEDGFHQFYSAESYIVLWKFATETYRNGEMLSKSANEVYFYWKGNDALKGFSPLPQNIERENPPVERIVQWAELPVFLRLFSGKFIVHNGKHNGLSADPHLYVLRGEIEKEAHLYEVALKKESLRSKVSFLLYFPKDELCLIWHGGKSSDRTKSTIKKIVEKNFGFKFVEIEEGKENALFHRCFENDTSSYFVVPENKCTDHNPRLFYFNKTCGFFMASEIECPHKSEFVTPFPFLQSHLYTADQPATFLLDDEDEIWIWQGWNREDEDFKSNCFLAAVEYAQQKSKLLKKLIKVHKVIAGYEPIQFKNLFPVWVERKDVVKFQEKDGVLPNMTTLIKVISHENVL